jgi:predicted Zn-dependent protease
MTMSTKAELHKLIDALDDRQADRLLAVIADPLQRSLMLAPIDDEPLTTDERAAIDEGEAAYQRGEWVADEDLVL